MNLEDPDIQKATLLYNDRVNTYRQMVDMDSSIDDEPTAGKVSRLAELRIRNLLCFSELQKFNDTGKFLLEHPLVRHYSVRAVLQGLLKRDPDQYLEEYRNVSNNVARYKSFLNRGSKDKKSIDNWKRRLEEHQSREKLMKEILSEQTHA